MAKDGGQPVSDGSKWLLESFVGALVQAIEAMTSERAEIRWQAGVTAGGDSPWMWWQQPITAGQSTTIWVGSPETSWNAIGQHALAAAGIPDATPEDCSGTWKEILGQALSSTAQAFTKRLKREVNCQGGQEVPSAPSVSSSYGVEIALAGQKFQAQIGWNDAISQLIEPAQTEPERPAAAAPKTAAAAAAATASGAPRSRPAVVENSRTLELLLEVELPVSVSFGRAQLPLKEVLKLNSGSIVELNRSITEPVDLIVNNCVIARGEVVVVEGNYGVRIKQIISREERLRTLY
jgi:flagellar motor switch protein FliN